LFAITPRRTTEPQEQGARARQSIFVEGFVLQISRKHLLNHPTVGVVGEELFSRLEGVLQQHISLIENYDLNRNHIAFPTAPLRRVRVNMKAVYSSSEIMNCFLPSFGLHSFSGEGL
jgi:hypothetical protein